MVRILLVEDSDRDAELVVHGLRRAGLNPETRRVQTEPEYRHALAVFRPQVILSDFTMPRFDGMQALSLARSLAPDTPFIFVSGTIGEESAIRALKNGATDYVLKTNLLRLPAAIERALKEAREHADRRETDRARRESEAGLRRAQSMAGLAHVITAPDGSFERWSESLPRLIGVKAADMPADTREWLKIVHPADRPLFRGTAIEAGRRGARMSVDYRLRYRDGKWIHVQQVMEPLQDSLDAKGRTNWFNTLQDVTAQRHALRALQASEERYRATFEQTAVGIVHTSLAGDVLMVNPAFCEMTGYTRAEAVQLHIRELTHPEDIGRSIEGRTRILSGTGAPFQRELRLVRKDRSHAWVNVTTALIRGADGNPSRFVSVINDVSERRRAEQEVYRLRLAMDATIDSIYLTDVAAMRFVYVNDAACDRLGYGREQLLQMGPHDVLKMDREELRREYDSVIAAGSRGVRTERRFVRNDRSEGATEIHRRAFEMDGGWLIVTIGRDITERKAQQERIERLTRVYAVLSGINALIVRAGGRNELFREACRIAVEAGRFRMAWIGVVNREAGRIEPVAWNGTDDGYIRSMPLDLAESAPGRTGLAGQAVNERRTIVADDMATDPRIALKSEAGGRGFHGLAILPLFVAEDVVGVLALYAAERGFFDAQEMKLLLELAGDISFALEHIAKSEQVDYLALYDQLTGLANRTLFLERLNQSIHATAQSEGKFALVLADIERLRTVNESLGRQAGDALLRQVAERISRTAGRSEVGRIGADQFAVVLTTVKGRSEAMRIVQAMMRDVFSGSYTVEGAELRISAKAGITLYPNDGTDAEALLKNAEAALRKGKQTGEPLVFYTQALTERTAETLSLESKLRQALEKEEFVLHYQPKVELASGKIVGAEALIRWQSPELGLVPPMKFIPLMEETGMILQAGAWALSKAVADHLRWVDMGLPAPRVAVNVSPIQLRKADFRGSVEEAIRRGAKPAGIDLEITESLIMEDIEGNIRKLKEVRDLGLGIAIDDFGTGYSSLAYLAKLPVQMVKIDRSFIITMLKEPDTMTLVQTIISLAHSLKLKVVAEGVDSEEQAKILRLLRCDQMQGYLFSRPVPFDEMSALLSREEKTSVPARP